jgi:hypothetical protein
VYVTHVSLWTPPCHLSDVTGLSSHQIPPFKEALERSRHPDAMRQHVPLICIEFSIDDYFFFFSLSLPLTSPFKKLDQPLQFIFSLYLFYVLLITILFLFLISHEIIIFFFNFILFYFLIFQIWSPFFWLIFLFLISYKIIFYFQFTPFIFSFIFGPYSFDYCLFCLRSFFRFFFHNFILHMIVFYQIWLLFFLLLSFFFFDKFF